MKVVKRDGKEAIFNPLKVREAIAKAADSVGISNRKKLKELTDKVLAKLDKETIQVEEIQNKIEETLVTLGEYKMAKAFILYRQKRTEARRLAASLGVKDDLKLQTSSLIVLAKRYLLKDEKGKVKESPLKLYRRVSRAIARVDEQYRVTPKACKLLGKEFFDLMVNGYFLPNCVSEDTLISTDNGIIPISDIKNNLPLLVATDEIPQKPLKFYDNGPKKALRILTDNGYEIQATPEHYFRIIDEKGDYRWEQLRNITNHDFLVLQKEFIISNRIPILKCTNKLELSTQLSELIGYMYGDGCIESGVP